MEAKISWLFKEKKISKKTINKLEIFDDGKILKINVFNFNNELIGQRTRNVELEEQWRQQSDTPLFPFNHININLIKPLIIAEGETSALTIYDLINENVIGTPGTIFKENWIEHFAIVPKVYVIPDNDRQGKELALKIKLEFSKFNVSTHILSIPEKYNDISKFYTKTDKKTIVNWWKQKTIIKGLLSSDEKKLKKSKIFCYTDFINYGEAIGDMPYCFLEGLALVALSTILAPKLNWQGTSIMSNLKPNLAIILAADSTRARKTESLKLLLKLILDIDQDILIPQYFSPEALINIMADRKDESSLLLKDEWGRLQEKLKRADWTKGTKELLIQLIDGQGFIRRTISKGTVVVRNPFLSIAGAATIESLVSSMDEGDLLSGYVSRLLFMVPNKLRPRKSLLEFSEKIELYNKLLNKFKVLKENSEKKLEIEIDKYSLKGKQFKIKKNAPPYIVVFKSNEILSRFDEFVAQMEDYDVKNPHLSPTHTRLAWITLKVAILLAAANFFKKSPKKTFIEIDNNTLIYSIKLAEKWMKYQIYIAEKIGGTKFENKIEQIIKFLITPKTRSEIMKKMYLNARDTNELKTTMVQRNLIEVLSESGKTKNIELWRLK